MSATPADDTFQQTFEDAYETIRDHPDDCACTDCVWFWDLATK